MGQAWGGNTSAFAVGLVLLIAVVRLRAVRVVHWGILSGVPERHLRRSGSPVRKEREGERVKGVDVFIVA